MSNLDRICEAATKAKAEIEAMKEANRRMKRDIEQKEEEDLCNAKEKFRSTFKLLDLMCEDGSYSGVFDTGLKIEGEAIRVTFHPDYSIEVISPKGNDFMLSVMKTIRRRETPYEITKLILANIDSVCEMVEHQVVTYVTEICDKEFVAAARENDKLKVQWAFTIMSHDPFYVDKWCDEDLVCAMENVNVPVTKENLGKMRKRAKAFFEDKSYMNECLVTIAQDL